MLNVEDDCMVIEGLKLVDMFFFVWVDNASYLSFELGWCWASYMVNSGGVPPRPPRASDDQRSLAIPSSNDCMTA